MESRTELRKKSVARRLVEVQPRRDDLLRGKKKLLKAILEKSQIDCLAIYNTVKHVLFRIFTRRQLEIKTIPQKLREKYLVFVRNARKRLDVTPNIPKHVNNT
jgi:hypothetical protein